MSKSFLTLFVSSTALLSSFIALCCICFSAPVTSTGNELYPRITAFWKQIFCGIFIASTISHQVLFATEWNGSESLDQNVNNVGWALVPCLQVSLAVLCGIHFDYRSRNSNVILFFWIVCYMFAVVYGIMMWVCEDATGVHSLCLARGGELFLLVLASASSLLGLLCFLWNSTLRPVIIPALPTLEYRQGLFAHITFSHMNELINLGRVKPSFELPDIPKLFHRDQCKTIFNSIGYEGIEKNPKSLTTKLAGLVGHLMIQQMCFQFVSVLLGYIAPLSLRRVLEYTAFVDDAGAEVVKAQGLLGILSSTSPWVAVLLMFLGPAVKCICDGQNYMIGRRMAVHTRAMLISIIYRRSLKVDLSAVDEGSGTLNNLMSVDVREIGEWVCYAGFLWCTLMEISLSLTLLYQVIGKSCLVGVALMALTVPLTGASSKFMDTYQTAMLKKKDERMSIISEILSGIRIIKWFTWEDNFRAKISSIREEELKTLKSYMFCNASLQICFGITPTLVGVTTFLVHTQVFHLPLSPATGFTSILLFNSLKRPMEIFPDMINFTIRCRVSYGRVLKFLETAGVAGLPSVDKPMVGPSPVDESLSKGVLLFSMQNTTLAWNATKKQNAEGDKKEQNGAQGSQLCCGSREYLQNDENGNNAQVRNSSSRIARFAGKWTKCIDCLKKLPGNGAASYSALDDASSHGETGGDIEMTEHDDDAHASLMTPAGMRAAAAKQKEVTILRDVNFDARQGELIAIVGSTGAGKSTLLAGILGECKRKTGSITFHEDATVAFVSQSSWIQNASIRDNILFGQAFDEERYNAVLHSCALTADLAQFPDGDMTDIGEKGVNLSGGQQQRVSLARAAYSYADIVIMDDPLSAVDAHVGDHIFKELICKYLVGRTRILVTHQIALVVPMADRVLCLDSNGGIAAYTTPSLLAESLVPFSLAKAARLGDVDVQHLSTGGFFDMLITISKDLRSRQVPVIENLESSDPHHPATSEEVSVSNVHQQAPNGGKKGKNKGVKLVEKEEKGTGTIGWPVYWFYISAGGGGLTVLFLLCVDILIPLSWFAQNYSLSRWLQALEMNLSVSKASACLVLYLTAVCFVLLCTVCKQVYQMLTTVKASRHLHERMLISVLGATVSWHDSQPSGRKTNRFSQDIYEIDNTVMIYMQEFLDCLFGTCQVVFVIVTMVPVMIPFLLPVLVFDYVVASKFVVASRELKRLESVNKSPVFVLFSESMSGISVIRACRQESRFFDLCCSRVDNMNRCHLYMWACSRWLNLRTQMMSAVVTGMVAAVVVLRARQIGSSIAGLTLVYALNFTDNVTFLARMHSECQMAMNSVERVMQYLGVDQERYQPTDPGPIAPDTVDDVSSPLQEEKLANARAAMKRRPSWEGPLGTPADWPNSGSIQFEAIDLRYRPMTPLVLKSISFNINGGVKVGVCGRSGAGKSSLLTALFRTVEPEKGQLWIDGVDVLTIPLKLLRKNLSIVPQDPVLFQGSVKSNLDPFDEASDEALWEALAKVHMASHVASMAGGTGSTHGSLSDKLIAEKGSNFSVGQRQLLCMARAILRRAKILILDEATASVDAETDALIQETVRKEFNGVTVLSIAHRLNTIAFYDKVMVVSDGAVAEFDSPHALLSRESSIFAGMCERSGDGESIRSIARAAEESRQQAYVATRAISV